ncbi:MAG: ketopantoate reductase family protein [Chloroflexi bacterium]|nr:MAG: ketopantoate reductase family protein [Chloroflexota bacterium]
MKILVYGAGPLGSLFAAKLHEAGHEVSLLARGQRLADLREHGIVLVEYQTDTQSTAQPQIVTRLDPEDAYDLVLVIMRKNRALEILPVLAANQHTPNILFLMNNAAGPGKLVEALGAQRVLLGFPMAAGYRRGHVVHYLIGAQPGRDALIPIGEVDGRITPRLQEVGGILASMPGFDVELRTDMDAWLKTHVALLMPSLAPAMRAAGRDNVRMAHTRDAIVLAIRAMREGFRVLRALGYPIVPKSIGKFEHLPEPILVWGFQKRLVDPRIRVAMLEHAEAAQDEIKYLADEFIALKRQTSIPTPAMDHLYAYFDPDAQPMPEGSAWIPMDWRVFWLTGCILLGVLLVVMLVSLFL